MAKPKIRPGKIAPPEPGLHFNVPFATYQKWDAMNGSTLVRAADSMLHLSHAMEHEDETQSDAMVEGSVMHAILFEPDRFEELFVFAPRGTCPENTNKDGSLSRRSKEDKAAWEQFEASIGSRTLLTTGQYEEIAGWCGAVSAHGEARAIIEACDGHEVSGVWVDPQTGIACKCRFDGLRSVQADNGPLARFLELKTTVSAKRETFARQCLNLRYAEKMGFYRWGLECIIQQAETTYAGVSGVDLIAIEKGPVGAVKVYEPSEQMLGFGFGQMRAWLDAYAQALKSGKWPGYGPAETLDLPEWYMRRVEGDAAEAEAIAAGEGGGKW